MKKLVLLTLATASLLSAQAQKSAHLKTLVPHQMQLQGQKPTATSADVFVPFSFVNCGGALFGTDQGGYISGVNGYGDKQKTMTYYLAENGMTLPASIDTVFAFFGVKEGPGTAMVTAKVYQKVAGGLGTLLGTSLPKSVANCDTSGGLTAFTFSSPISLTADSFTVTIDFANCYTTGDTLALVQTQDPCSSVNPLQSGEVWDDNTYHTMADPTNWGMALDMAIFPRVTGTTAIKTITKEAITLSAYPQPAHGLVQVSFNAKASGTTQLRLLDLAGKVLSTQVIQTTAGKNYHTSIDVSNRSTGIYFLEVSNDAFHGVTKVAID